MATFTAQVSEVVFTSTRTAATFTVQIGGTVTGGGGGLTTEQVQDVVGAQIATNGAHTGLSATYDDAGDGAVDLAVTYGTTAGTAAQGNDARLSDARTPTTHTHPASQVTLPTMNGALASFSGDPLADYFQTLDDATPEARSVTIVEAPADGTHTYIEPGADGQLPLVLVRPSIDATPESGRAHVILPDAADHVGETVSIKVGYPLIGYTRAGATIGMACSSPAVLGDLATWFGTVDTTWQASPTTLVITVNGTPHSVTLDEDYGSSALLAIDLITQLIVDGAPVRAVQKWRTTTDDTEPSVSAGTTLEYAIVTTTQGPSSSIVVTSDPDGVFTGVSTTAGADDRILWGSDRTALMSGHTNTHHSSDGATDGAAVTPAINQTITLVAIEDDIGAYWGSVSPPVRLDQIQFARTIGWWDSSVTSAQLALNALAEAVEDLEDSPYTDEQVRDVIGTALVAGSNITITPNDGADTITIAASGGGGTVDVVSNVATARILGRISSGSGDSEELTATQAAALIGVRTDEPSTISGVRQFNAPGFGYTGSLSTVTLAINTLYLVPVYFACAWTMTKMSVAISTAQPGSNFRVGVYAATGALQIAGAPVGESGAEAASTTGWQSATVSCSGSAGLHMFGVVVDTAGIAMRTMTAGKLEISESVVTAETNTASALIGLRRVAHTFGALPTGPAWTTKTDGAGQEVGIFAQWSPT